MRSGQADAPLPLLLLPSPRALTLQVQFLLCYSYAHLYAAAMQAHLPVLLPRLFRSSHDPSPRVAQSTLAILKALAPDIRRAVATHLNAVLADLVPSMVRFSTRVLFCFFLSLSPPPPPRTCNLSVCG